MLMPGVTEHARHLKTRPSLRPHRPTSKASLLALKAEHPEAKLVVGNTEVGIEMKFKDARYPVLIGATHVPELNKVQICCFLLGRAIFVHVDRS